MIVMNIAEWIGNFFILGIACLIWAIAIFGFITISSILIKLIKEYLHD